MTLWRQKQKESFTSLSLLLDFLELDDSNRALIAKNYPFPLLIPRRLAEKIPKNTLNHPLARQFIPLEKENTSPPGYEIDPVQDKAFLKCPKLLHKYPGRALIVTTGACAMNCRFCFRQNFNYTEGNEAESKYGEALAYIQKETSLHEVILSGGDPLSLSDETLGELLKELSKIDHIKLIRFHTRFPIGIPERIDDGFFKALKRCSKQVFFILHTNHASELDEDVFSSLRQVQTHGAILLSQTVLLEGVNDDKKTLKDLFLLLVSRGITPYYLHQFDRINRGSHFEVTIDKGLHLMTLLREELPGYAVPRYVQEIPGLKSKTPLLSLKGR